MTLWHLILGWCFVAPTSGALVWASVAKFGIRGYVLAIAVGLPLGFMFAWALHGLGRTLHATVERHRWPDKTYSVLYISSFFVVVGAGLFGYSVVSALARLAG